MMLQISSEKTEELLTCETVLKNEIKHLNAQISQLHQQHADELDHLSQKHTTEMRRLMEELARQKELSETGREPELVYYQRHLEAAEEISQLHDTAAEQQAEIEGLRENMRCQDAEIEQLKAKINSLDAGDGGLVAVIQLDLEHVSAER